MKPRCHTTLQRHLLKFDENSDNNNNNSQLFIVSNLNLTPKLFYNILHNSYSVDMQIIHQYF
jgi:hypothetical protein